MLVSALISLVTGAWCWARHEVGAGQVLVVAVELGLNLVLCTLILVACSLGWTVAAYGRDLLTGDPDTSTVSTLFFPPAVSLSALTLAVALAVVKPWGRTSWNKKRSATT